MQALIASAGSCCLTQLLQKLLEQLLLGVHETLLKLLLLTL